MSAGFPQERQGQPCVGFGGVSHVSLDRQRCVSCISRTHRQVSWHPAVFSGWRVMYVCGVGALSPRSCFLATGDGCVPSPLLTGLSRSVGCAHIVERQVHLVLAPLRALRIHCRVFARVVQEHMDTWTVRRSTICPWADVMHCVSFRLHGGSLQSASPFTALLPSV